MKLFPNANFIIETDCTHDEVYDILKSNIGKKAGFFATNKRPFYGECSGTSFRIIPNIEYRNSFIPIISGSIRDKSNKVDIEINMKLFKMVNIFVSIYLSMAAIFALIILIASFNDIKVLFGLIPCVMLAAFMLVLSHGAFNYEVKKRKKQLNEMFYVTFPENESSSGYYSF